MAEQEDRKVRTISPKKIAGILQGILDAESESDRAKEHFGVVGLGTGNLIEYIELGTLGLLDRQLAHPREVFKLAIEQSINTIILSHSHPSGI